MQRRRAGGPPWFLLIIIPMLLLGALLMNKMVEWAAAFRGIPFKDFPDMQGALISLGTFFLWIPLALLLSNCILFLIPALRRPSDEYAQENGLPDFWESQRQLLPFALGLAALCIPLIALGFFW